jgi:hypothetical protein
MPQKRINPRFHGGWHSFVRHAREVNRRLWKAKQLAVIDGQKANTARFSWQCSNSAKATERGLSARSHVHRSRAQKLANTALHFTLLRVENPRSAECGHCPFLE